MSTSASLTPAAAQEIQSLYDINRLLLLAQDMTDVVLTLRAVLAIDADAVLRVHVDESGAAHLVYRVQEQDEDTTNRPLNQPFPYAPGDDLVQVLTEVADDGSVAGMLVAELGGQSAIVLKLLEVDQLREVLIVVYKDARTLDEETLRLYDALVTQATIVMHNQNLLRSSEANAERLANQIRLLEALRALSEAVGSENEAGPVMTLTMRSLVEITNADHAGVVTINPDGISATVAGEYPDQGVVGAQIEAKDNPVFTELLKGRRSPLLLEDIETDLRVSPRVRDLLMSLGTKALIITPLIIGEKLIGSVGLDLYSVERRFTPDILDLVETLTGQLAVFLQDVTLRRDRERANEQVRILDGVGSRMLARNRVDDLLAEAALGLQMLLNTERVVIRLGDPRDGEGSALS